MMIYINGQWKNTDTLEDISQIIREHLGNELADIMDSLIPEHSDSDYEDIEEALNDKENQISDLEEEIGSLQNKLDIIQDKLQDLLEEAQY